MDCVERQMRNRGGVMNRTHDKQINRELLSEHINTGLLQGDYQIYLQPKFDLSNNQFTGAEALVRYLGKDKKVIRPDKFIPYLEETEAIYYVDLYVLNRIASLIHTEEKAGNYLNKISVNFSRVTLKKENIIECMLDICAKNGISPKRICIEMTETSDLMDIDELQILTQKIRSHGFLLSLDDYGSGYSNVILLANIKFDEIKIDKSIVREMDYNEKARQIVKTIISMGKTYLNTIIVAEGIESLKTLNLLKSYHCDQGQGYYLSKPMELQTFVRVTRNKSFI